MAQRFPHDLLPDQFPNIIFHSSRSQSIYTLDTVDLLLLPDLDLLFQTSLPSFNLCSLTGKPWPPSPSPAQEGLHFAWRQSVPAWFSTVVVSGDVPFTCASCLCLSHCTYPILCFSVRLSVFSITLASSVTDCVWIIF